MEEMIKALSKRAMFMMMIIIAMIVSCISPFSVYAESFMDGNKLTIGGNPTINDTTFEYEHGKVTVSKKGILQNTTSIDLEEGDEVEIKLLPDEGYQARLHNDVDDYDLSLNDNSYTFKVGHADSKTISLTPLFNPEGGEPGPGEPEQKNMKFDFRLNGVDFTDCENEDIITVQSDFNMDKITEFYIKKIVVTGENETETYYYNDNEYSYELLDDQGRTILEANFEKVSDNYVNLRVLSHEGDIQDKDKVEGRIYYGFYLTGVKFVKSGFKGVEVSTPVMPDSYDFTQWNGVDLSETTKVDPGKVTTYYGEDTISFDSIATSDVKKMSLVSNSGVPSSAVTIDNTNMTVKVLSNYYNEIPLEIELEDGTVGYITVDRIGIFVDRMNVGDTTFYHGASADVGENMNVDTDKSRIVAVFYHEDTKTYNDYDLIVNMVFKDGSTKISIAKGVGDVHNSEGDIVGSDYILWASATEDEPVEVYVTAVSKNALSNSNTFGGATFGSGAGVKWTNWKYEREE